jgi:hypothetical protein
VVYKRGIHDGTLQRLLSYKDAVPSDTVKGNFERVIVVKVSLTWKDCYSCVCSTTITSNAHVSFASQPLDSSETETKFHPTPKHACTVMPAGLAQCVRQRLV